MLALACILAALAILAHATRDLLRAHRATCDAILTRNKLKEPRRYA